MNDYWSPKFSSENHLQIHPVICVEKGCLHRDRDPWIDFSTRREELGETLTYFSPESSQVHFFTSYQGNGESNCSTLTYKVRLQTTLSNHNKCLAGDVNGTISYNHVNTTGFGRVLKEHLYLGIKLTNHTKIWGWLIILMPIFSMWQGGP